MIQKEPLDSRFLFPNPLLPLGEFLMKFSEQSLFPVSVRNTENTSASRHMKIIMHNQASAMVRGFRDSTQVGMSIAEILETSLMSPRDKEAEMQATDKNDQEAIHMNHQNVHHQTTLDGKGFVRVFQRIITPLSGYHGTIVALSTISLELTQYTNPLHLLELYKKYYDHHSDKEAIVLEKFCNYFKLDVYFTEALTLAELTALLASASDSRHKQAAALMTEFCKKPCTISTLSTHLRLIQQKLKPDFNLQTVLYNLRDYYQVQPMLFE